MPSKVARVMKRPAGQVQKASVSTASSPKKCKLGLCITGQFPESILSVLRGEVPKSSFEVLAAILETHQELNTSVSLQEYEEVALQMASEAITDVKDRIEAETREAQTKLASVEAGWAERSSISDSAQDELAKIKHEIAQAKLGIKMSVKAIASARLGVQKTRVADNNSSMNPTLLSEKNRSLEAVEKDVFQSLKQASVKGARGKKKLQHLKKMGKRFGFHDVLLNTTMPKVALKCLDKRQTFDRLVFDQMEAEFAKKHVELENALKHEKSVKLGRESALQLAHNRLADAQQQRDANASRLAQEEKALALGKQSMVAARRELKKFDRDSQKIVRESTQLEARLSTFLDGPLAAFKKLEMFLLPPPLVKPPGCEVQSTEMRVALTRALTRIGTMAVPPSPVEMEEDGDLNEKNIAGEYAHQDELDETD